jgi:hypothetical protein
MGLTPSLVSTGHFGSQVSFGASSTITIQALHDMADNVMGKLHCLTGALNEFSKAFQGTQSGALILERDFCQRFVVYGKLLPKIKAVATAVALADPHMEWNYAQSDSFDKYTTAAINIVTDAHSALNLPVIEKGIRNSNLQWTRF